MQRWRRVLVLIAGISALSAVSVHGTPPEDGEAVFARRQDTMKRMDRPLYLGIGRVVKGKAPYGADTVSAAETIAALTNTLAPSLFASGSNVPESRMKPEIFVDGAQVEQLIAAVQSAASKLVPAVNTGDEAAISAAYTAVADACNACHKEFRKEE